jgi:hypothetical protein
MTKELSICRRCKLSQGRAFKVMLLGTAYLEVPSSFGPLEIDFTEQDVLAIQQTIMEHRSMGALR